MFLVAEIIRVLAQPLQSCSPFKCALYLSTLCTSFLSFLLRLDGLNTIFLRNYHPNINTVYFVFHFIKFSCPHSAIPLCLIRLCPRKPTTLCLAQAAAENDTGCTQVLFTVFMVTSVFHPWMHLQRQWAVVCRWTRVNSSMHFKLPIHTCVPPQHLQLPTITDISCLTGMQ